MTLSHHFVSKPPPANLDSKPFQAALQDELALTFLSNAIAAIGVLVSIALVLVGALVVTRTGGSTGFPGTAIAVAGAAAGVFVLVSLWRRKRIRNAYKTLLAHPQDFKLHHATITRISSWALSAPGSDRSANRISWDGEHPGAAVLETDLSQSLVLRGSITLAVARSARNTPPLLVSISPPNK